MLKNIYLKSILLILLLVSLVTACSDSSSDELMTSNQEVADDKGIAPSLQNDQAGSGQSEGGTLKDYGVIPNVRPSPCYRHNFCWFSSRNVFWFSKPKFRT